VNIFRLIGCFLLHLTPKFFLERWLTRRLSPKGYTFFPRFSGRAALFDLASTLRRETVVPVALFPEYVCNIVPKALTEAGWIVESYKGNEKLEAEWVYLLDRIKRGDVGLLVGATVFGSSGLLDDLIVQKNLADLKYFGVRVIVDLAQDIRLVDKLPEYGNDLISSIVSFNDKSFPGIMGGGVITNIRLNKVDKLISIKLLYILYKKFIIKTMPIFIKKIVPDNDDKEDLRFEYSFCDHFPFRLSDNYRMTKLQFACAIQGIFQLKKYEKYKRYFLNQNIHLETRFASSAAYLIVNGDDGLDKNRKRKASYAVEHDMKISVRPTDFILHNKGFDDHA